MRLQAHIKTFLALFVAASYATAVQPGNVLIYQGKLTVGTTDFDGTGFFKFALVNNAGTKTYWSNDGKSVAGNEPNKALPLQVARGKYVVALGDAQANMVSLAATDLPKSDLRLRVWFSPDKVHFYKLTPDQAMSFGKNRSIAGTTQHLPDAEVRSTSDTSETATRYRPSRDLAKSSQNVASSVKKSRNWATGGRVVRDVQ